MEIWKDIENYEELYQISNLGRIRSKNRTVFTYNKKYKTHNSHIIKGKLLKPKVKDNSYLYVTLCKNKLKNNFYIHRLVAKAFILNINNFPVVNHIDSNRQNNNVDNLEWCSVKSNVEHSFESGNNPFGSRHKNSKIKEEDCFKIIEMRKTTDLTVRQIGEIFGLSQSQTSAILNGRRWNRTTKIKPESVDEDGL